MATSTRSKNMTSDALLEQVRLLKIENEALRSFITEKGFGETLKLVSPNSDEKVIETRSSHRLTPVASSKKSPNVKSATPRGKGCSCKGTCSHRCGCVKKKIPCTELCRCRDESCPNLQQRQLSRSPLTPRTVQRPRRIDGSNIPLPIPVIDKSEDENRPPEDLAKDVVDDWDKHQAMLVKCSKCRRTFHQHRVKIHEMLCRKI